ERGKSEPPVGFVEPAWSVIADQAPLLQASDIGLEGDGVIAAPEVEPGHAKRNARADSRLSQGLAGIRARLSRLEFQSQAVVKRVALGLLYVDQHIFFPVAAFRVLHRRVHLAEY